MESFRNSPLVSVGIFIINGNGAESRFETQHPLPGIFAVSLNIDPTKRCDE